MLKETGIVVKVSENAVDIETALKTSCSSCSAKQNCGTSALADIWNDKQNVIQVEAESAQIKQLKLGQKVEISVDEQGVLASAFLVYILPLIAFFIGFTAVEMSLSTPTFNIPWFGILFGSLSWLVSLIAVRRYLKQQDCKLRPAITISKIFPQEIPSQTLE